MKWAEYKAVCTEWMTPISHTHTTPEREKKQEKKKASLDDK